MTAYPLNVRLQPCKRLLASVLSAHGAAALALFYARVEPWLLFGGSVAILASAVLAVVAERRKRGLELVLGADGSVGLRREQATPTTARVCPGIVVFGHVVWLELAGASSAPGSRRLRLMLIENNLPAGRWRAMKVWLRHRALNPAGVSP